MCLCECVCSAIFGLNGAFIVSAFSDLFHTYIYESVSRSLRVLETVFVVSMVSVCVCVCVGECGGWDFNIFFFQPLIDVCTRFSFIGFFLCSLAAFFG